MNRELRRKQAKQFRAEPVTRSQRKRQALAFISGISFGVLGCLVVALMASVG